MQEYAARLGKESVEQEQQEKASAKLEREKACLTHIVYNCIALGPLILQQAEAEVDIQLGLAAIRLTNLPHGLVPDGPLAAALATKAKGLNKKGVKRPFPFEVGQLIVK